MEKRERFERGTFGAASDVRAGDRSSVEPFLKKKAARAGASQCRAGAHGRPLPRARRLPGDRQAGAAMRVTREWIMDQRSPAGGWNRAQLKALGTGWPPRHGWLRNLLGRTISDETARRVEALRGKRTEKEPQPMLIETPPPETAPSEREDRVFMDRSRKTGEPWRRRRSGAVRTVAGGSRL